MQQLLDAFKIITVEFERIAEQLEEAEQTGRQDKLLNVEQLAAELNVPKSWIYGQTRLTDGTGIPHLKIGKYCRFRLPDVLAWLENRQGE